MWVQYLGFPDQALSPALSSHSIISPSYTFVSFLTVPVLFIHAVVSLDTFWTVHGNRVPTQSKILGMAVIEINSNSNLILLFLGVHVLPANLKEQEKRAFVFLKFPVSPERSKGLDPWVLYRCSGLKGWGSGHCCPWSRLHCYLSPEPALHNLPEVFNVANVL